MVLAKGIFKVINIQDSELEQLAYDHSEHHSAFHQLSQHSIQDLVFRSDFLLAVCCSIFVLAMLLAF